MWLYHSKQHRKMRSRCGNSDCNVYCPLEARCRSENRHTDFQIGATAVSDPTCLVIGHEGRACACARARACMLCTCIYTYACPASPLPSCCCEQPLSMLASRRRAHHLLVNERDAHYTIATSRRTAARTLCGCVSGVSAWADPLSSFLAPPTSTLSNLWLQKPIKGR